MHTDTHTDIYWYILNHDNVTFIIPIHVFKHLFLLLMPWVTRQSSQPKVCHVSKRLENAAVDGQSKNL